MNVIGQNNIYSTVSYWASSVMKTLIDKISYYTKSSVPTDNAISANVGDIVWNTGTDNVIGWKCTVAGSPGTWKTMQTVMP